MELEVMGWIVASGVYIGLLLGVLGLLLGVLLFMNIRYAKGCLSWAVDSHCLSPDFVLSRIKSLSTDALTRGLLFSVSTLVSKGLALLLNPGFS